MLFMHSVSHVMSTSHMLYAQTIPHGWHRGVSHTRLRGLLA